MPQFTRRAFHMGIVGAAGLALLPSWNLRAGEPMVRSPITNRWGKARTTKVETNHRPVFRGRDGSWYNAHPQILSLGGGRLIASWSIGALHEDDPGQYMAVATSADAGETWTSPRRISPVERGRHAATTHTAMGVFAHADKLVAYYGRYDWTELGLKNGHRKLKACVQYRESAEQWVHEDVRCEALVSDDTGQTWSAPRRVIDHFVPNLRPHAIAGGRLIMPGNITYAWTDDPAGLTDWTRAGLPRLPTWTVDCPEGFHKGCHQRGDAVDMCEGSFFETDDGTLRMMLRTIDPKTSFGAWLAVTESRDRGATWSEPMRTDYSDGCCRFHFGRLPDGRWFGLSCPDPTTALRTPLVLATSADGVVFDRHYVLGDSPNKGPRKPGMHKSGVYGYPSCHIADGVMHVVYMHYKEDIMMCSVDLARLD